MAYEVIFPSERVERLFQKTLKKVTADFQEAIISAIRSLSTNPRPQGKRTKKLTGELIVSKFVAQYRLRLGSYRVLYDIDDKRKTVVLLKLAKRDEGIYN